MTTEGEQILSRFKEKGKLTLEYNGECWSDLSYLDGVFIHEGGAQDFSEQDFKKEVSEEDALYIIKKLFIDNAKRWEKVELSTDQEVLEYWDRLPNTA